MPRPGVGTGPVHAPGAELDWTGSPSVSLGYRLGQGCGSFVATYQFLVSEGTDTLQDFDPAGAANGAEPPPTPVRRPRKRATTGV